MLSKIQTERLILMPLRAEDEQAVSALLQNEKIGETYMVPLFKGEEEALDLARKLIWIAGRENRLMLGMYRCDRLIGMLHDCGIENGEIELGYVVHPNHQGKGYATEAVRAVLEALHKRGFRKVKAGYFEQNTASFRVMQKCGMRSVNTVETLSYRGREQVCRYCEVDWTEPYRCP